MARFALGSTAFQDGQAIPAQYACDGDDVSPPLSFEGLPPGAAALALVLDDPDAPGGTWIHWAWWNLPVQQANLAAGADVAALGATVGNNSWGRSEYGGPCPPSGTHRYQFHAYALGQLLDLPSGAGVETLRELADHRALAKAVLTGTYTRP